MAVFKRTRKRDGATVYAAQYFDAAGEKVTEEVIVVKAGASKTDHNRAYTKTKSYADEQRIAIENGTWKDPRADRAERLAFAKVVERFLGEYLPRSRDLEYYRQRAKPLVANFGKRQAEAIGPADVEAFRNRRLNEVSPATVKKDLTVLSMIFDWAAARDLVSRNPATAKMVKRPHVERRRTTYLTDDEEQKLLAVCLDWLSLVVRWAIGTGMDREEIVRLSWSDIDDAAGVIHAPRGKTSVPRDIPLNDTLRAILAEAKRRREQLQARLVAPITANGTRRVKELRYRARLEERTAMAAIDGGGRVFLGEMGGALTVAGLKTAVLKAYCRAGLSVAQPFKIFRHTFASRLAMKDVPPQSIARLMGHSTTAIIDTYMHLSPSYLRGAMAVLDPAKTANAAANGPAAPSDSTPATA